jgi:hypothetical protein
VNHVRASSAIVLLLAAASCTDASYTIVHIDVTPQRGLTFASYDVHVGEFEHSMPPTDSIDVVVPTPSIGQPTAVSVAAMNSGQQVAYGAVMVTPAEGVTTDAAIALTANTTTCATSCTLGETVCADSGEATTTCELGSDGCLDWSTATSCPTSAPFCSNGACAASCTDECTNVGDTDCDGDGVRTCQTNADDSCLGWSVPVACDEPPDATCISATTLRTYGAGTCSDGACEYAPSDETCQAPANGSASCDSGACDYVCDSGYVSDGNGNCVVATTCSALECGSDADCGDSSCGPCEMSLCFGALQSGGGL